MDEALDVPQRRPRDYDESPYPNPLESRSFGEYVSEVLEEHHTPGISIAVVHKDKTWAKGFGYSHLTSKEPVTPRTLFFAGSTTKSFTAAVASKLVYSNESQYSHINWSTRLADLIRDDFVLQNEYATNHITLTDALSHRTGMPRHDLTTWNGDPSIREQVRRLRHVPLHNEIRTSWEYCNKMFTAVSHAVETVVAMPMSRILEEWIWRPLGMHETFYTLHDALKCAEDSKGDASMARSYLWDNEIQAHVEVPFTDVPPANGSGGIITNVIDYTHWVRQFLYPSRDGNPLDAAVKDMTAAHMPVPPSWYPYTTRTYGLGLETVTYRGHLLTGHRGAIAGYMAAMYWFPELEWGFVALQNNYSFAIDAVQFKLMDDFLDSIGAQGSPYDIRGKARELEKDAAAELEKGSKKVFPDAPDRPPIAPALPLSEYEGTYHHPAYQDLTLSIMSSSDAKDDHSHGASLLLFARGSPKGYLDMTWTFHHVSGEHWWVNFKHGPGWSITDELLKAKFEVGVDGKVSGLGLQAEKALDELAWFKKVY
jgi:CubicO group peptidase (beta-lactamase class C family)